MYTTHTLGPLTLQLFEQMKSHVSVADFCATAATVEFAANDGLLENDLILFKLSFPGFELEARCREGMIFLRRNGLYQHSEQMRGRDRLHVAIQWNVDSIACGVAPWTGNWDAMSAHMRAVRTPQTVPPLELHRMLRAHNLLVGEAAGPHLRRHFVSGWRSQLRPIRTVVYDFQSLLARTSCTRSTRRLERSPTRYFRPTMPSKP